MLQSSEQRTHEEDDREYSEESQERLPLGEPYVGLLGTTYKSEEASDDYISSEDEREIDRHSSEDFPLRVTASKRPTGYWKHRNDTTNRIEFQPLVSLKR
jgi:hypothetical protein